MEARYHRCWKCLRVMLCSRSVIVDHVRFGHRGDDLAEHERGAEERERERRGRDAGKGFFYREVGRGEEDHDSYTLPLPKGQVGSISKTVENNI